MAVISLASEVQYYETMSGNDAFTVIIRGVAYLDFELDKLLRLYVVEHAELKGLSLDYAKRCSLAFALGLDRELKPALTAVGNLRNKLAHDPERHLTAEDADNLYSLLSVRERQNIPAFLDTAKSPKVSFPELGAMDKYVLMLVLLRSILVAARHNIENAR